MGVFLQPCFYLILRKDFMMLLINLGNLTTTTFITNSLLLSSSGHTSVQLHMRQKAINTSNEPSITTRQTGGNSIPAKTPMQNAAATTPHNLYLNLTVSAPFFNILHHMPKPQKSDEFLFCNDD